MERGKAVMPLPAVRRPRVRVRVNDKTFAATSVTVVSVSHYSADTFEISAPLAIERYSGIDYALNGPSYATIDIGYADDSGMIDDWVTLIAGNIDTVRREPLPSGSVTLSGRDLSSVFLDQKISDQWPNATSSEIITKLGVAAGLDVQAQATTALVGTASDRGSAGAVQERVAWDVMVDLAKKEGFDLWVSGRTLYFQAPNSSGPPWIAYYTPDGRGGPVTNLQTLALTQSLTLANDITVFVKTWNSKTKAKFTGTAKRSGGNKSGRKTQIYTFSVPGLTQDQAQAEAQKRLAAISKHERVIDFSLPGDSRLSIRDMIRLDTGGALPDWEQDYYPENITRSLSVSGGFTMSIRAKNQDQILTPDGNVS